MLKKFRFVCFVFTLLKLATGSVEISEFFPYTQSDGATTITSFSDDSSFQVSFSGPFKFLNKTYWHAYVSSNGLIALGSQFNDAGARCTATGETGKIMPFWADMVPAGNSFMSFYETSQLRFRLKAEKDIVFAFPSLRHSLSFDKIAVITWSNMRGHNLGADLRNTFQAILAYGGKTGQSYVIFYYNKIESIHASDKIPLVGFNYGDGSKVYTVPDSCTTNIKYIATRSNINQPGRWVFRVDSEIVPAGTFNEKTTDFFRFDPTFIPAIGSLPMKVEGLFLEPDTNFTCEFHDLGFPRPIKTRGLVYNNGFDLACQVPFLSSLGEMRVDVVVPSSTKSAIYQGKIFVVPMTPEEAPKISLNRTQEGGLLITGIWKPEDLKFANVANPTNGNSHCQRNDPSTVDPVLLEFDGRKWKNLGTLSHPVMNTGVFVSMFNMTRYSEIVRDAYQFNRIHIIGLQAKQKVPGSNETLEIIRMPNIMSGIETLYAIKNIDAGAMCNTWYENEHSLKSNALNCPPSIKQAHSDWRFGLDKNAWNLLRTNTAPALEISAVYIQLTPSSASSTAQCAYDAEGHLMPFYSFGIQKSPLNPRDHWSYYWGDVLPYYYCSKWSNNTFKFLEKRGINTGLNYKFPRFAKFLGLGHVVTFDGLQYEFLFGGEFVIINYASGIWGHSHLEEFRLHLGLEFFRFQGNAEFLPRIAVMKQTFNGNEITIRVRVNDNAQETTTGVLAVHVDGELLHLGDPPVNDGTVYYLGAMVQIRSKGDLLFVFATGFCVNIFSFGENPFSLGIITSGGGVKGHGVMEGLWGDLDGDAKNDLKFRSGSIFSPSGVSQLEVDEFVQSQWLAKPEERLIPETAELDYDGVYSRYYDENPLVSETVANTNDVCENDTECFSDFNLTSSVLLAEVTKVGNQILENHKSTASLEIKLCPEILLEFSYFSLDHYFPGGRLEVKCPQGYELFDGLQEGSFRCQEGGDGDDPRWKRVDSGKVTMDTSQIKCTPLNNQEGQQPRFDVNKRLLTTPSKPSSVSTTPTLKPTRSPTTTSTPKPSSAPTTTTTKSTSVSTSTSTKVPAVVTEETRAKLVSSDSTSLTVDIFVTIVGIFVFIIIIVVCIAEAAVCRPVKQRILTSFGRNELEQQENISL